MQYFAHSKGEDKVRWQELTEHLLNTSKLAAIFGQDARVSKHARLAALLHDLGKFSVEFQKRLEGAPKKVDHSTAGAQYVMCLSDKHPARDISATILAYCIAAHHRGLPDYGHRFNSDQDTTLWVRPNRKKPHLVQVLDTFRTFINLSLSSQHNGKIWFTDQEPDCINLRFSRRVPQRGRETHSHPSESIETQLDGSSICTGHITEPTEMLPWIRGWGANVEVLEQGPLRNAMAKNEEKIGEFYREEK